MSQATELTTPPRAVVDRTMDRARTMLEAGELTLPPGYAWQTELRSAWLILQGQTITRGEYKGRMVLDVVTQASVASSLLDMVVQGLSLVRKQGYLIPYGDRLTFQRSYFGTIAAARRLLGLRHADAQVVYEGDSLRYRIVGGRQVVDDHASSLANMMAGKIIAVYVVLAFDDASLDRAEIMTMDDVRASWGQSKTSQYNDSPHQKFAAEMAKRTVISRALKTLVNGALDASGAVVEAWNRSDEDHDDPLDDPDVQAVDAGTVPLLVDVDDDDLPTVDADGVVQDEPVTDATMMATVLGMADRMRAIVEADDGRVPHDDPGSRVEWDEDDGDQQGLPF